MLKLGDIAEAHEKVRRDVDRVLNCIKITAQAHPASLEESIQLLSSLRRDIYEDLNQIQHEYLVLLSIRWLVLQQCADDETVWSWNPRQTGDATEPDLRGEKGGATTISAEVTTSVSPQGLIDHRMRTTLEKLSLMVGKKFYFVLSDEMRRRAETKIRKFGWNIQVAKIVA